MVSCCSLLVLASIVRQSAGSPQPHDFPDYINNPNSHSVVESASPEEREAPGGVMT